MGDIKSEIDFIRGKKVFFIDETFSGGRGAAAIKKVSEVINGEIFYFALTKDPNPEDFGEQTKLVEHCITPEMHQQTIHALEADPHFVAYRNPIQTLFSRELSRFYIDEDNYKTVGISPNKHLHNLWQ